MSTREKQTFGKLLATEACGLGLAPVLTQIHSPAEKAVACACDPALGPQWTPGALEPTSPR